MLSIIGPIGPIKRELLYQFMVFVAKETKRTLVGFDHARLTFGYLLVKTLAKEVRF